MGSDVVAGVGREQQPHCAIVGAKRRDHDTQREDQRAQPRRKICRSNPASAVNKLAVRLAAGNDRLAQLVRRGQDLASEAETLDKAIVAAVSKERAKRDPAAAVDSEAATRLTTSTFDRLKADRNLGRAEALRQAMLAYLNDTSSPKNAYPAFWGPFALIGEDAVR